MDAMDVLLSWLKDVVGEEPREEDGCLKVGDLTVFADRVCGSYVLRVAWTCPRGGDRVERVCKWSKDGVERAVKAIREAVSKHRCHLYEVVLVNGEVIKASELKMGRCMLLVDRKYMIPYTSVLYVKRKEDQN